MWISIILTIASFILSVIWAIVSPGFEPVIAAIASFGSLISSLNIASQRSEEDFEYDKSFTKPFLIGGIVLVNTAIVIFAASFLFSAGTRVAENLFSSSDLPTSTIGPTIIKIHDTVNINSEIETGPGGIVYFGSSEGIFKSEDYGLTWKIINNGFVLNDIFHFAIDLESPSNVLVSTDKGIWYTNNGGEIWHDLETPELTGSHIGIGIVKENVLFGKSPVLFDFYNEEYASSKTEGEDICKYMEVAYYDNRILCFTNDNHHLDLVGYVSNVDISEDGGRSWNTSQIGGPGVPLYQVDISQYDSEVVYVAAGLNGVLRSLNGGYNWQNITANLLDPGTSTGREGGITGIVSDPLNPRIVYVARFHEELGGIYRFIETQNSWEYLGGPLKPLTIAISPTAPEFIFIQTQSGLYRMQLP